jgi:hypothetical protein
LVHGVRQQGDANANFPNGGNCFVDVAQQSLPVQGQRQAEATDAAADDRNFHKKPFGATLSWP